MEGVDGRSGRASAADDEAALRGGAGPGAGVEEDARHALPVRVAAREVVAAAFVLRGGGGEGRVRDDGVDGADDAGVFGDGVEVGQDVELEGDRDGGAAEGVGSQGRLEVCGFGGLEERVGVR